jgi:LCP family protein required for cell wall assembly
LTRSALTDRHGRYADELDEDPTSPARHSAKVKKTKSPLYLRLCVVFGALLLVISGGALVASVTLANRYEDKVGREDILAGVPMQEIKADEPAPMNFLVLGSDSRSGKATEDLSATGSRSDTIMIVHIDKTRTNAFITSIPRDSYINVPAGGSWKGGKNKINAAMAFGGANLTAKTVYELTQIPLNGAMIVNFQGVHAMVGAVGGVHVCIPYTVRSVFSTKVWEKGCHDMGPEEAEEFMRQRMGTPGGDFGRIKNQQHVIKALANKVTESGTLANPVKLDRLLTTAAQSLTVDKNLDLRDLVFALKGIDANNIRFATVPAVGTMNTDAGSSVELDMAGAQELFQAIRDDLAEQWLVAHPQPEVASIN